MKRILLLTVIALTGLSIKAQDYDLGIGVRFGKTAGLSAKYFFQPEKAVEGILHRSYGGYLVTGLLEVQKPFHSNTLSITSLNWYWGIGGHAGYWSNSTQIANQNESFATAGVNGIFGLEYLFIGAPFAISADIMPFWSLNGNYRTSASSLDLGVTIKYVID